jgi:steroid delta-isomerase-like uncharacterized protein
MTKQTFIVLLAILPGLWSCNSNTTDKTPQTPINKQKNTVTVETLKQILEAFNRHDLDAIMEYFSDDCSFDFPKGPEPWGQRFIGKAQVRQGLASRFKTIPDVHYGEDSHWVSADGDKGVSEWTLTGTTTSGVKLKVRGCDLWEFRDGKVTRKNSYWKIVEQTTVSTTKEKAKEKKPGA